MSRVMAVVMSVAATAGVLVAGAGQAAAAGPLVSSGSKILIPETPITESACTLGAIISPTRAVTAGHCGGVGQIVYIRGGARIGRITTNLLPRHIDLAVITLAPGVRARVDALDYSGSLVRGQAVTKQGAASGFSAGRVTDPVLRIQRARGFVLRPPFLEIQTTLTVNSRLHSVQGDSGAGIRSYGRVVGILSSGTDNGDTQFAPLALLPPQLR